MRRVGGALLPKADSKDSEGIIDALKGSLQCLYKNGFTSQDFYIVMTCGKIEQCARCFSSSCTEQAGSE